MLHLVSGSIQHFPNQQHGIQPHWFKSVLMVGFQISRKILF